jgi:integrase
LTSSAIVAYVDDVRLNSVDWRDIMGCVYRQAGRKIWWVKYKSAGKQQYESSNSSRKGDAIKLLRLREGDTAKGIPVTSEIGRMKYEEALADLLNYHKANGRTTRKMEARIRKHLTPFFTGKKMADITTALVNAYIARRREQSRVTRRRTIPVAPATINRELAWLKHMFNLAVRAGKLMTKPSIDLLQEHNVRTGFFEPEEYQSVMSHLQPEVQAVVAFAYLTGWRTSEVKSLTWKQVDWSAGEVRLEPGTTKNKQGRTFPFTPELRALLERQRAQRVVCDRVFFRMVAQGRGGVKRPRAIVSFGKAFKTACRLAGCPGRTPHDLRRTAVRDFVREGIPQTVAMKLTGHLTESVFRRYDIVSPNDLRVAAEKLARRC